MSARRALFLLAIGALLAACNGWLSPGDPAQTTATGTRAAPGLGTATQPESTLPAPEITTTPLAPAGGASSLRVWLPPQFDPAQDSPAAALLLARLDAFAAEHPGVRIEVRVKALEGPGGLFDSLSTASAAAPLALPDLIALPRPMLESAALKGLLHPADAFDQNLANPDWYPYAQALGRVQNSAYGLPFAGDALAVVYRPSLSQTMPLAWEDLLTRPASGTLTATHTLSLTFPAADSRALYPLALYQIVGGSVQDEQGLPIFEANSLTTALTLLADGGKAGLFTPLLTLYENDQQSWDAFQNGQTGAAITWVSRCLQTRNATLQIATLPSVKAQTLTLATGWVWALGSGSAEQQELAAQLAAYLTDAQFLAQWTQAAGVLPPRAAALSGWQSAEQAASLHTLALSARLLPAEDLLAVLGQPLKLAVIEVLKQHLAPAEAAEQAIGALQE